MITQVIFTVFTFAFGISPRELARRPSGSSRAMRRIRASVKGTLGRRAGVQVGGAMALPLCHTVAKKNKESATKVMYSFQCHCSGNSIQH